MPTALAAEFHALHAAGCFVLPNPWDIGTAVVLHRLGFKALATTSAGAAFARGLPDAVGAMTCDAVLDHLRDIVGATPLPVQADFQSGHADDLDHLAANITRCLATGVAGLSLEDATGDPAAPLYPRDVALERLRAARRSIDASGTGAVLTARCESYLVGVDDPAGVALDRLVAYAEAGADCLFAPGVRDPAAIATLVRAVAPRPLNVLVSAPVPGLSLARLADLGVRRVSVGSALARAAWGAFLTAARGLARGDLDALAGGASFAELDALFAAR
jgi:2-methylisocitrate lyase-like PEP mutase family enzyme